MKSSLSSKSVNREKEKIAKEKVTMARARIRRGSSLSDLDKLQNKSILPDVVRSIEKCSESLPHSPALSRTNLQLCTSQVKGSIGDLMNLKKYGGSNWSVRSESIVAKAVPLSTVTFRHSPWIERDADDLEDELTDDFQFTGQPLTCAQRTQRFSRLIKKQRRMMVFSPNAIKRMIVSSEGSALYAYHSLALDYISNTDLSVKSLPNGSFFL